MDFSICDACEGHVPQLEKLERACFSLPWTEEQLKSQLPDNMHCFIVAQSPEGEVLGYVGMMYVLDEGYISNVAVSPEHRKKGIGDKLIDALTAQAERLKLSFLSLEVRKSNIAAQMLYSKHGFYSAGVRKNYYDLPREDAIIMTKFMK